MNMIGDKVKYVLRQPGDNRHTCHWPGCEKRVPPAMWGCRKHWYTLPASLRSLIWSAYKPGQEISKTPSHAYVAAARKVQQWIEQYVAAKGESPSQGSLL